MFISRRDLIKSLSLTAAAGSMLRVVPFADAEKAHRMVSAHKAASPSREYAPKFFPERQYKTLQALCQAIIPPDQESGGAVEAGAPEFIDLLSSENKDLQLQLGGGIMWLDAACMERYGQTYLQCTPGQQTEMLDLIAFRKNADKDSRLSPGIEFFDAAQIHRGRIFHQRNWNQIPRLYRQHLPEGVSRLPLSTGSLSVDLDPLEEIGATFPTLFGGNPDVGWRPSDRLAGSSPPWMDGRRPPDPRIC